MPNPQEPVPIVQNGVTVGSVPLWPCHLSSKTICSTGWGWDTETPADRPAPLLEWIVLEPNSDGWWVLQGSGSAAHLASSGRHGCGAAAEEEKENRCHLDVKGWVHHLLMHTGYLQPVYFPPLPRTEQHIKLGPCCAGLAACPTANSWGAVGYLTAGNCLKTVPHASKKAPLPSKSWQHIKYSGSSWIIYFYSCGRT